MPPMPKSDKIWFNGKLVPWDEANIHVLSHVVHYGSRGFEGIRCYKTERGPAVFRLQDHVRRLYDSAKIYRMVPDFTPEQLAEACKEVVRKNELTSCYIRPMVLRGYGAPGINPFGSPIETFIPAWPWGAYLGEDALKNGVDVCVSSWLRAHPNTYPQRAKAGGHYLSAQLMKMEALENGYVDAIALAPTGLVSEGSGMNLFLVRNGVIISPFLDGTSLEGITRDSIILMANDLGYEVREQDIPRESLYTADELFFTGTAAEVTPVRSVDRITIGSGTAGPVSLALQEHFWETVKGENDDPHGFLTYLDG